MNFKINPSKMAIAVVVAIIIRLVLQYIFIRLDTKPLIDWWYANDGKQYDKLMNLQRVMSIYHSRVWYYIMKWGSPVSQDLTVDQCRFLVERIFPYQTYTSSDNIAEGIVTPKSLAKTVLLDNTDAWVRAWTKLNGLDVSINAEYTQDEGTDDKNGITTYTFTRKKGNMGVYPSVSDTVSWMGVINDWLGPGWGWKKDKFGMLIPGPKTPTANYTEWINKSKHPDNFLARMDISPDAPMVVFFCNNQYSTQGTKIDAQAMKNLIGMNGPNAGGWMGFVQGQGNSSFDELKAMVDTTFAFSPPKPPQSCEGGGIWGSLAAGASAGIPIGIMAVGAETGGLGFIFGGIIMAGIGFGTSFASKC